VRRLAAATVAVVVLAGCSSGADAADVTLCREVERVTEGFVATAPRVADADGEALRRELLHEVRIGASHLLVAAGGDRDGEPDPDLAGVVRAAGSVGVAGPLDGYADALFDAEAACAAAGAALDDQPFDELRSLVRGGLPAHR
jgi:hypothetical protein